jgi:NAD(P)-dependent dehydrogenase (short-subunit alcohol dehydrogenase family)
MAHEKQVAVITGAAGVIGRVIAATLARQGMAVLLTDRLAQDKETLSGQLRAEQLTAHYERADVGHWPDVSALAESALSRWGRLDVWVNNAAVHTRGSLADMTPEDWRQTLEVNLTGPFFGMKAALPTMVLQGRGVIVNIASVHAMLAYPRCAAYDASKGGLVSLSRQAAAEYGPAGVRINCILPGAIAERDENGRLPMWAQAVEHLYPVGRVGKPQDVADTVSFLTSDAAQFVNGAALILDGGMSARSPEWQFQ